MWCFYFVLFFLVNEVAWPRVKPSAGWRAFEQNTEVLPSAVLLLSCWPWFLDRLLINFDVCVCSQVKQDFFDLLSEQHIEGGQRWSKVKERLETDPRYKAVESSALREELFKQYMEKQAKVGAVLCMEDDGLNMYVVVISDLREAWKLLFSAELNIEIIGRS